MKQTAVLVPLLILLGVSAISYPRLTSESATACVSCHINPAGAGMRNEFGNHSVAFNELTLQATKKLVKDHYRSPRIADALLIGFDTRYLIFDDGSTFRMQTDGHLLIEPFRNLGYYLRLSDGGISENYALITFSDRRHYLKAGRFYPAFGLHTSDHKGFHRERTGHPSNFYIDGLSLGATVENVRVTAEALDRAGRFVGGINVYRPWHIRPVKGIVGFSVRLPEEVGGSHGDTPHAKAAFGSVSYDRFTLMGELDLVGKSNDTLISYANFTARLIYGLYAIAEYNFFDGNRDLRNGVEEFIRLSIELFPIPFVQLRPSYTYYTRGPLEDEDDFFVQFHVGY
jgi:hypothetical protein